MKKTIVFLLAMMFSMTACHGLNSGKNNGGTNNGGDNGGENGNNNGGNNGGTEDPTRFKDATFKFYLDYSHSDEPILTFKWYVGEPLGTCPQEAVLTNANAADPLYPTFLGYSTHSSSIDETYLWDFSKDVATTQSAVLLYGIWVGE